MAYRKRCLLFSILSQVAFSGNKGHLLLQISDGSKKKFAKDRGATRGWRTCSVCSPVYRFVLFLENFCILSILHYASCGFVLFLLFAILAFLFATYSLFFFFFLFDFSCVFLLLCFSFSIIKRYILRSCFVRLLDFAFTPPFLYPLGRYKHDREVFCHF